MYALYWNEKVRKEIANSTLVENRWIWRKFGEICRDKSGETNFTARLEQPIQVRRLLLPTHVDPNAQEKRLTRSGA